MLPPIMQGGYSMRVTIVADDNIVLVGSQFPQTVDCSALVAEGKHAVQWYETYGEVEFKGGFDVERGIQTRPPNQFITDFSPYQSYLDAYNVERAKELANEEATLLLKEKAQLAPTK